jgi:hypothetical protein
MLSAGRKACAQAPHPLTLDPLGRLEIPRQPEVNPSAHEEARMDDVAGAGSKEPTAGFPKTGDPDMDHLNELLSLVRTYDDRALVLALAAFAEDTLGRLLVTYLREGKQGKELVEGFNAPLGTLSSRIRACYAIGLLTHEQYEDLEVTRKIRNSIAHSWVDIALDRQDMRALIGQLNAHTFDQKPIQGGPRDRLLAAISNILDRVKGADCAAPKTQPAGAVRRLSSIRRYATYPTGAVISRW